jgi:hypothetical protein
MATFRSRSEGLAPTRKPTYRRCGLMVGLAPSDGESDAKASEVHATVWLRRGGQHASGGLALPEVVRPVGVRPTSSALTCHSRARCGAVPWSCSRDLSGGSRLRR